MLWIINIRNTSFLWGHLGEMAATDQNMMTKKLSSLFVYFHLFLLLVCSKPVPHSIVRFLPGFSGSLPFYLETGYLSVDETNDVQLFYYFVKSERSPEEDPVVLWLTGGPGCSALTGLAYEIGPLYFKVEKYNGSLPTLTLNPHSWTKVSNIIFLDAPVLTGFSYSTTFQGSMTGDTLSAEQTYNFLRKWFIDHPDFLSNPLYVAGDSYSGFIVPIIVQNIADGIEAGHEPLMNLKGYVLGNPLTDPIAEGNSKIRFAHCMAILSDELYESLKKNCGGEYVNVDPCNVPCLKDLNEYSKCIEKLNEAMILEPSCSETYFSKAKEMSSGRRSLDEKSSDFFLSPSSIPALYCREYGYMLGYYWANNKNVQNALHIRKGTIREWIRCNRHLNYKFELQSSVQYHLNLSARGFRSLIYSGDHDMNVPFMATQAWIRSLNYSIIDDWRRWFSGDQIGGYSTPSTYITISYLISPFSFASRANETILLESDNSSVFLSCRYTRTYSNKMTFATVKGYPNSAVLLEARASSNLIESITEFAIHAYLEYPDVHFEWRL
ncbi:hypothetical protein HHK36_008268 [Tetracentron sinense]|uniref:Uncharacterized protein n=1 Tax=Tetracentron sinense TaxID=13715 RepID=A0A835DJ61_TETSI|nr:hypothetical protein HHK36_008268 [Tetracentron sinense]